MTDFHATLPNRNVRTVEHAFRTKMLDGIFENAIDGIGARSVDPNVGQCFDRDYSAMPASVEVSHDDFHVGIATCKEGSVIGIGLHLGAFAQLVCIRALAVLQHDDIESSRGLGHVAHARIGGVIGGL